jgi:hypothetical protein
MASRSGLPPLCRFAGHTCAACCWGEEVSYSALDARLRRQTGVFARRFAGRARPGRLDLLLYELDVRGAADVFWGMLLLLPLLGDLLRPILLRRLTCAFLGYEDGRRERVGCMLHPSRWAGRDARPHSAFALLRGIGCGAPDWYCLAAHFFAAAPVRERRRLERRSRTLNWYAYSRAASRYHPARPADEPGGPQMSTMTSASQPSLSGSTRRP